MKVVCIKRLNNGKHLYTTIDKIELDNYHHALNRVEEQNGDKTEIERLDK